MNKQQAQKIIDITNGVVPLLAELEEVLKDLKYDLAGCVVEHKRNALTKEVAVCEQICSVFRPSAAALLSWSDVYAEYLSKD